MLHRNAKDADIHEGKWNGLGGKFEPGESPAQAAKREFLEEASADLPESAFRPLGVLQFPDFKPEASEDWIVWVFEADWTLGGVKPGLVRSTREGDLHWVPEGEVTALPLWEGDREFIPLVLERRPFLGTYWYEAGGAVRSELRPL